MEQRVTFKWNLPEGGIMMMTYDVACPICGRINHSLYLEETEGWMECEQDVSET